MGKHAAAGSSFWASLIRPLLGLVAVGVVIGVVAGVAYVLLRGGEEEPPGVASSSEPFVTPSGVPSASVLEPAVPSEIASVALTPVPEPAVATPTAPPAPTPAPTPVPKVTEQLRDPVAVQVLDAGGGRERTDDVVATLTELGYEIVAVNGVRRRVDVTTVMWNDNHKNDALALLDRDDRFSTERKNDQYTPAVPLHVLVGPDWP